MITVALITTTKNKSYLHFGPKKKKDTTTILPWVRGIGYSHYSSLIISKLSYV